MKRLYRIGIILSVAIGGAVAASAQTTLATLDGGRVNIEGHAGKVVLLSVGAAWVPLSSKQAEYTNALAKKYAGKDVVVYFIATDSNKAGSKNYKSDAELREFASINRLSVPILRDFEGAVTSRKFGVEQVPSFVIIDKNGDKSGEIFGGIDPKYDVTIGISKAIDKLL